MTQSDPWSVTTVFSDILTWPPFQLYIHVYNYASVHTTLYMYLVVKVCVCVIPATQLSQCSSTASPKPEDVLRRKHNTLESCAKACLQEKDIPCKYFKFVNATGTCYLSSKDHPNFKNSVLKAAKTQPKGKHYFV